MAPTCPDAVNKAVSSVALTFPSVRLGMYCQCAAATGPGNTFTKISVVIPPSDACAVSNFATVPGDQTAPTRPPISVGELPTTVPDADEAAFQVIVWPATPRR